MDRRQFHLHLLLAGLVPGMARAGTAPSPDGYPDRPIRIVVPYPAGGVVDVVLRAVCDPLSNALPQRIVVDNRPGADGRIGISGSVLFALNSDQLQPEGRQVLKSLAAPLAAYLAGRDEMLMVSGFTDDKPVRDSNQIGRAHV